MFRVAVLDPEDISIVRSCGLTVQLPAFVCVRVGVVWRGERGGGGVSPHTPMNHKLAERSMPQASQLRQPGDLAVVVEHTPSA